MSSIVLNVTFDCADPALVARFWGAVTKWPVHQHGPDYSVGPSAEGGPRLYFVQVPEPKIAKNRLHLDMIPPRDGQRREIARLVSLGASVLADQPAGAGWVVLADPEGNEFCVEPH